MKVAQIFNDNMILQRDCKFSIWGTGIEDEIISITFCGQCVSTRVNGKKWMIELQPISVGGPYIMVVTGERNTIVLRNILLGDVFLAGGQSNMELTIANCDTASVEFLDSDLDNIRYFQVPKIEYEFNMQDELTLPTWEICSKDNFENFSAVALYFAKKIKSLTTVPIGIINCNWGGTSATCWIPKAIVETDPALKVYLKIYDKMSEGITAENYKEKLESYITNVNNYLLLTEKYKATQVDATRKEIVEKFGAYPWPPPAGPSSFMRPGGLYETMLEKIIPFSLKGVLFYQGESDTEFYYLYRRLFTKLIDYWRSAFKQSQLPFLFVQLPYYDPLNDYEYWPLLREAQKEVADSVRNVYMVVATDCGERDDIHPKNKKKIGERLAYYAEAMLYRNNLNYGYPSLKAYEICGNKIVIQFRNCLNGLVVNDKQIRGFMISENGYNFVEAKAAINGQSVVVWSDQVKNPIDVKYGWKDYDEVNLYNMLGLPVGPFRLLRDREKCNSFKLRKEDAK